MCPERREDTNDGNIAEEDVGGVVFRGWVVEGAPDHVGKVESAVGAEEEGGRHPGFAFELGGEAGEVAEIGFGHFVGTAGGYLESASSLPSSATP